MTEGERERAKADFKSVRAILHGQWDPIGGGAPLDEYDSYCWPVLALLRARAGRGAVEDYLRWAADTRLQCPVPEPRLRDVVDRLMTLERA